jgi:MFS family permease
MAVAMLITGVISSRLGMKWTLLSGIIIIAVFSALGGLSNGIWALVDLRGGWGLGNDLFVATALAAIVTLSNSGTATSIILYEAAVGLGISVGPLLGGWLGAMSWRGPFLGVAVLMIAAFICLTILMPKSSNQQNGVLKPKTSILDLLFLRRILAN